MSRRLELPIGPELAGIKVDTLLKRHLGLSGTVVRRIKWLEDGILVDGRRVNTRYCPQAGECLSVRLSDPERRSGIVPAPGPRDMVYEEQDRLGRDKAPGGPVPPGPGHCDDTVGDRDTLTIQSVIFCSLITTSRARRGISIRSTAWTGGPPACWWWPGTPTPRRS